MEVQLATLQGDFANAEAAEGARFALHRAGIADTRIRKWNILKGGGSGQARGSAVTTGAVLGGALAGDAGLVAGASVGALVDGGYGDDGHLPELSGVCIVVDMEGDEQKIKEVLISSGAGNVHNGPVAR